MDNFIIPTNSPIYKSARAKKWKINRMLQINRKIVEPLTFDDHLPCIQLENLLWRNWLNVTEILLHNLRYFYLNFIQSTLLYIINELTEIDGWVRSIHILVYGLGSKSNISIILWHNCLCCLPKGKEFVTLNIVV